MAALTSSSSSTISTVIDLSTTSTTIVPMDGKHIDQLIADSVNRRQGTVKSLNTALEAIRKMLSPHEHASGRDFCMRLALGISDIHHPDSKFKALNLFIRFLLEDPLTPESSVGLVDIAEKLMNVINPNTATSHHNNAFLEKYLECYALVIEMILVHYGKGHIPSLLKDFKTQLEAAETKIKALCENQQIPAILHACALISEGLKRVKTDQKISAVIFAKLKSLTDLVKQVADKNLTGVLTALTDTVKDLDRYVKASWYKNWLTCMALAREISPRIPGDLASNLIQTLHHTVNQHIDSDWHFTYGAIRILERVATQQASTPALRNTVILGGQPNLISCLQFDRFKQKALVAKSSGHAMDLRIRQIAVTALQNFLIVRSEDRDTCLAVKFHLIEPCLQEKDAKEMSAFLAFIPQDFPAKLSWLNASAPIVTVAEPSRTEIEEKQQVEMSYEYSKFNDEEFAKIVIPRNVTHLSLRSCPNITDKSLERLTLLPNLRHLNLKYTNITGAGFGSLPSTLRSLNLRGTKKLNATSLPLLQNLPLEDLNLAEAFSKSESQATQHSTVNLEPLAKITSLLSLNLYKIRVDLASVRSIVGLRLHTLVVSGEGITDAVIKCISEMP